MLGVNYLDNDHSFLDDIANARLNQIQQHLNTSRSSGFDLDGGLSNSFDRFADKVDVNLRSVSKSARSAKNNCAHAKSLTPSTLLAEYPHSSRWLSAP